MLRKKIGSMEMKTGYKERRDNMAEKMTAADMLEEVNSAIYKVLVGGQSYKIGSRQLTRADLSMLREMKKELEAEVNQNKGSSLLDDTYVVFFDGR